MRRLIVNADDFGLTLGINRAIVEAHTGGIVTSSTLMANGPAFADAVGQAKGTPSLVKSFSSLAVIVSTRLNVDAETKQPCQLIP